LAALRRFHRPFVLIQFAAVLLVVAYHVSADVRAACAALAVLKSNGGLAFAAASAAVAGGLLPEIAKLVADHRHNPLSGRGAEVSFNVAFFAFNGVVIDGLYRVEARLFGAGASLGTVFKKTAFDQFVFNPVWLALIIAIYAWRGQAFRLRATVSALRAGGPFYRTRVVPLLLPMWCFWIPMVLIIYALPVPLQFLLFVLALGAWSLIMVFIAEPKAE
jgi:hypothetical protein